MKFIETEVLMDCILVVRQFTRDRVIADFVWFCNFNGHCASGYVTIEGPAYMAAETLPAWIIAA